MEPIASISDSPSTSRSTSTSASTPYEDARQDADSGSGCDTSASGGTIVHWQERITLHYRLFPAGSASSSDGAEGEDGDAMQSEKVGGGACVASVAFV